MKENGDIVQFLKQRDYIMLNNELGRGSFGKTVLLKDPFIDEIFVAKKYEPELESDKNAYFKNFLDEIKIMYKLNHKNIVRIFNYYAFEEIHSGYILMEYIEGVNIGKYIADYFEPVTTLDELFIQLIDGFQYIEEHRIIHRDIRESNILVDGYGIAKIIDFGIGKTFNKLDDCQDSLHSEINRANSDTLPQEYAEGIYTSKTDQFYLAEMFTRLMRESEQVSDSDFSYHSILSKMMQKNPINRYDNFAQIKAAIGKHDFSDMNIAESDKIMYQVFANAIYGSLSEFIGEQKFNNDVYRFIARIDKALVDNAFEHIIQNNADIISSVVVGKYKYREEPKIECEVVRDFINWYKMCIPQSQNLILNNLIHKLSIIKITFDEDDLPF
jgi:serine/threonine-protein kinase